MKLPRLTIFIIHTFTSTSMSTTTITTITIKTITITSIIATRRFYVYIFSILTCATLEWVQINKKWKKHGEKGIQVEESEEEWMDVHNIMR